MSMQLIVFGPEKEVKAVVAAIRIKAGSILMTKEH